MTVTAPPGPTRDQLLASAPLPTAVQRHALTLDRDAALLWRNPHLGDDLFIELWHRALQPHRAWRRGAFRRPVGAPAWTDRQIDLSAQIVADRNIGTTPTRVMASAHLTGHLTSDDPRWSTICTDAFTQLDDHLRDTPATAHRDLSLSPALDAWAEVAARPDTPGVWLADHVEHLGVAHTAAFLLTHGGDPDVLVQAWHRDQTRRPGNRPMGAPDPLVLAWLAAVHPDATDTLADTLVERGGDPVTFTLCAPWRRHPHLITDYLDRHTVAVPDELLTTGDALALTLDVPAALRDVIGTNRSLPSEQICDIAGILCSTRGPRVGAAALAGRDPHHLNSLRPVRGTHHPVAATGTVDLDALCAVCGNDPHRWALALELADGHRSPDELADLITAAGA